MSQPGAEALRQLAAGVLEPVLVGSPFETRNGATPGAGVGVDPDSSPWPVPESSLQLLWCATWDDLHRALPEVWRQARQHAPDDGGGCADVTVDIDVLGRLVAVDVEGTPLARLLAGVGEVEASAAADELPGLAAEVALPAVADLLERLLAATTSSPSADGTPSSP